MAKLRVMVTSARQVNEALKLLKLRLGEFVAVVPVDNLATLLAVAKELERTFAPSRN